MVDLNSNTSPPWVIAHRGFSAHYPENTHAAFTAALKAPIQAIETDIQMSKDQTALVFHNRTLLTVGGGLKRIRSHTASNLATVNAAHGHPVAAPEPLPKLDDVLSRYGQSCVWLLEIKRREPDPRRFQTLMDLVIDAVRRHQLADRVCILCYNLELLEYGHSRDASLRFVLNQDKCRFLPKASFLFAYSANIKHLNADFAQQVHESGKPLFTFTCNHERHLKKALSCGVNGVMSDNPAWLAEALKLHWK